MTQHVIGRFKGEPLEFDGELLCRTTTDRVDSTAGARWFQLELYGTESGQFVAATKLCTDVQAELPVTCAERLDTATDVENFFFAFEPDEYMRQGSVTIEADEWAQFASDVYARFEMAVRELLAELPTPDGKDAHVADAVAKDRDGGTLAG